MRFRSTKEHRSTFTITTNQNKKLFSHLIFAQHNYRLTKRIIIRMPTFEAASPAGESTTEFLLYSEEGGGGFGTSTSTAEEEAFSSPVVYREDISNSQREQLLYDETNGSVNRVRLTSSGEELHSLRRTLRRSFSQRRPSHLNGLNYLNVVTYAAHLFVSYGIGIWGLNHILETRWEIIMKYETLVTPAHWAYYLWAPIVIMEGFFSLAQLLPHYRARSLIQGTLEKCRMCRT